MIHPYSHFNIADELHTIGLASYTMGPTSQIEVGSYCSIAGGLTVLGERHPMEEATSSSILYDHGKPNFSAMFKDFGVKRHMTERRVPSYKAPPTIGHDVWIGQNVTLARGITIGTGSVIAGASLVVKSVEPYTIVGGNPAHLIRRRFNESLSKRLLDSEWWTINPAQLFEWLKLADPNLLIEAIDEATAAGELRRHSLTPLTAVTLAALVTELNA